MTFGCKEILVQAQNLSTQTRQPGFHRFRNYLMAGTKRRRSQVSSAGYSKGHHATVPVYKQH